MAELEDARGHGDVVRRALACVPALPPEDGISWKLQKLIFTTTLLSLGDSPLHPNTHPVPCSET